jgi:chemotaxis protein CheX
MDPQYITPFIKSTKNVFSTMLNMQVTINEPTVKIGSPATYDVSGIIGMSGDVVGSVVLSFPKETAERLVTAFCGMEFKSDSPDFADAIGELVNMVSGSAKGMFVDKDVSISCPSVVIGSGHQINTRSDTPCVSIPCSTPQGDLTIEVAIREAEATSQTKQVNSKVA